MHLLDTSIVLALRHARDGSRTRGISAWAAQAPRHSLFLSAVSLFELEQLAARDGSPLWRQWLDDHVMRAFDGRILAVDVAIVRRAAQLDYRDARDGLLAATTLEHGLTLATDRPRAFKAGRIKTFDPAAYVHETSVEDWRQAARATPAWVKNLFVRS
jgi:toxin FitB